MKVAIDVVPEIGRPPEIERAIAEAHGLRDRYRRSQEELAEREAELRQLEADDVAKAAERARKGTALGAVAPAVEKAKQALDVSRRDTAAIALASEAAQGDLSQVIAECVDVWVASLGGEIEQAREAGRAAVAVLEDVCGRISTAASARNWLSDGRFDTRPPGVITASVAPSSKGRTANSEALQRGELLGYVRELLDPPMQTPPRTLRVETPEPLDDIERAAVRR